MMGELSEKLDFSFVRNGSLVLCFSEDDRPALNALYEKGIENGVPQLTILTGDEVRAMEPSVSETVTSALYAPTGGIVCPFGLTIALAENACDNGTDFLFETEIEQINKTSSGYDLISRDKIIHASYVVNAAGVYSDVIHNMVSENKLHIIPRKGDYCLLDKEAGTLVSHTIFQLPGKMGKGILVTPTVHGNLLTGPTAVNVQDREETSTTAKELADIMEKAAWGVNNVPFRQVITSFSGLRAHEEGDDFVVGEVKDADGFFDAAGMESPGLSSAPAVGVYLAELIAKRFNVQKKEDFIETRKGIVNPQKLSLKERAELIKNDPRYGTIICRCEGVSEGEIADAINRTLGAVSIDGIKRRVRAGMGRCQSGFCIPKTMEILARETGRRMEDICKNRSGSNLLTGKRQGGE